MRWCGLIMKKNVIMKKKQSHLLNQNSQMMNDKEIISTVYVDIIKVYQEKPGIAELEAKSTSTADKY